MSENEKDEGGRRAFGQKMKHQGKMPIKTTNTKNEEQEGQKTRRREPLETTDE